jgi:hypothetical protein
MNIPRRKIRDEAVIKAIEVLKDDDDMISPEAVVAAARPKNSPLHEYFDWEDSEAARCWRLHQARNLIRVCIRIEELPNDEKQEIQVFVSLPEDRNDEGGYRVMTDVLNDDERREALLEMALKDLQTFRRKYAVLKELASVFTAIEKLPLFKKK